MSKKIDELLAILNRAIRKLSHIEHDDKNDDAYCLICKAENLAKELRKQ